MPMAVYPARAAQQSSGDRPAWWRRLLPPPPAAPVVTVLYCFLCDLWWGEDSRLVARGDAVCPSCGTELQIANIRVVSWE